MSDYRITKEGKEYLENGLPEKNLLDILEKGPASFSDAREKIKNFPIALQWTKKKKLVEIKEGKLYLVKKIKFEEQDALLDISEDKKVKENILNILIERNLVEKIKYEFEKLEKETEGNYITHLTPELLKTRIWKKAKGFSDYETGMAPPRKIFQGKLHPYRQIVNDLREKMIGMGFEESRGPFVESSLWNFDALFIPQNHPARSESDSFVIKTKSKSKIDNKGTWERIKATHEFGWITGSKGWGKWDPGIARKLLLRTQTTTVSARTLNNLSNDNIPHKMFTIDRVFRRDVIDSKHLIDFDQCEGILVGKDLNFKHLMGYLEEIGKLLGAEDIMFKPSYFPFTEPSMEVYVKIKGHGWVEIGGAGIMRPEVTYPLGIEVPVIAWAFGIGRLVMIKMGIIDIRDLYSDNIKWLREKSLQR